MVDNNLWTMKNRRSRSKIPAQFRGARDATKAEYEHWQEAATPSNRAN